MAFIINFNAVGIRLWYNALHEYTSAIIDQKVLLDISFNTRLILTAMAYFAGINDTIHDHGIVDDPRTFLQKHSLGSKLRCC